MQNSVGRLMRLSALSLMLISLAACETVGALLPSSQSSQPIVQTVNECSWTRPIQLSEATISVWEKTIAGNPQIRKDAEQVASHNEAYEKFCGQKANPGK